MERDYRRRWWTPWRFLMMLLLCFVILVFLILCLRVIFEINSFFNGKPWLVFHFSSKYFNESFVIFEIFERTCSILTSLIVVMESLYKCCSLRIENIPCYKAGWNKVNFLKKKKKKNWYTKLVWDGITGSVSLESTREEEQWKRDGGKERGKENERVLSPRYRRRMCLVIFKLEGNFVPQELQKRRRMLSETRDGELEE